MDKKSDRMNHLSIDDFQYEGETIDSLYRLVNLAAKRANQLNRPDARPLVSARSRKPVMMALEEVLDGKVWYRTGSEEEDEYEVG